MIRSSDQIPRLTLFKRFPVPRNLGAPPKSRIKSGRKWPAPSGARRVKTFETYRYNPDSGANPPRGQLAFMVFHGKFDGRLFVQFMQRLLKHAAGKVYLIVDGHPVHRSVLAKAFVEANAEQLRLIRMPGYCPELNPDELLNQDVKTNALGKSRPSNRAEMMTGVRSHLYRRQRQPQIIRNLFQEKMFVMLPELNLRTIYRPAQ
jgi:hypothetical protein